MNNFIEGRKGEAQAVAYLRKSGLNVLQWNYRNYIGEIDVIALDKDILCFVEVKTRTSYKFGLPREAVNFAKQRKIIMTSQVYLQKCNLNYRAIRYDVLEVCGEEITYIKDAFQVS